MIEIKFDVTNTVEALKVRAIIDSMCVGSTTPAQAPVAPAATPAPLAPSAPTFPTQAPVAPVPTAPMAPAGSVQAPATTATTPPPAQQPAAADLLSDAGLQGLVQRVAQAGVAVPSILQELQACGATKVSELQPQMRQMFRDKLVALTGGAIQ